MEEKSRTIPYPLRMPDELRAMLESSAKDGSRSLHAEIVARLSDSFEPKAAGGDSDAMILDQAAQIWKLRLQLASTTVCLDMSKKLLERSGDAPKEWMDTVNEMLELNDPVVVDITSIPAEKLIHGSNLPWSHLYEKHDELQKEAVAEAMERSQKKNARKK